jgi:DNA invertase Pin-like site-specific DNA recombinase
MNQQGPFKVTAAHLQRTAYLYVRQSTVRQVFENTESTKRQYALRDRALAFGWAAESIQTIDSDLGQSGVSSEEREGFRKLVAEVGLGHAGIVMGLEVSRLARNSADWHRLIEICALTDTLILDEDGVYNPGDFNDRLLLGLKGTMSEAEIHVMRARLRGGILNKARRGELRTNLPVGFVYDSEGRIGLDPDQQVQAAIRLLFQTFLRTGTATATAKYFRDQKLLFPRASDTHNTHAGMVWGPLYVRHVLCILRNPRYAGAYFYGRYRCRKMPEGRAVRVLLPPDQWNTLIRDAHPGYISWEEQQSMQEQLRRTAQAFGADRHKSPPREGQALLQGRVICGLCGNRMSVHYRSYGRRIVTEYRCAPIHLQGDPPCQVVIGTSVDAAVAALLLEAITPMAVQVAIAVQQEIEANLQEADQLRRRQVERARYEAESARQRYLFVDPLNRLVARSLETHWNEKLRALAEAEDSYDRQRQADQLLLSQSQQQQLSSLVKDFPAVWNDPATPHRERKRMLGLLVEDVTLVKDTEIKVHVRFRGGATTTLKLPLPRNAWQLLKTPDQVLAQIDALLEHHTEAETVAILNQRGLRTGAGKAFTMTSLRWVQYARGAKSHRQYLRAAGLLTAREMASKLGKSEKVVRTWRRKGILQACRCDDGHEWLYYPPDGEMNMGMTAGKIIDRASSQQVGDTNTAGGVV